IGRIILVTLSVVAVLGLVSHLWALWQYRTAQQAVTQRDFVTAQDRFEHCLKIWFLSSKTYLQAGRAARRAGKFDDAAKLLQQSRSFGGDEETLDVEFKLLRAQQGDLASVQGELEGRLEEDHPESVEILEVLTPAYLQTDQLNAALNCADNWLAK